MSILNALDIHGHEQDKASIQLGVWTIETTQDIDESWTFYSKAWHKSYGPRYTVDNRAITFSRKHGRGTLKRSVSLTSWSGNYVEKAIVELGLQPKNPKLPLRIRLNKAYDAKLIKTIRGHKIYQRTLLNMPVDYVIIAPLGTTYHDADYPKLIRGLYKKIRANAKKNTFDGELIDWNKCKKLGFCESGIREFCGLFNLNAKKQYSVSEIATVVKNNLALAQPFLPELKTLAAAYNYPFKI